MFNLEMIAETLKELNIISTVVRLALALLLGGMLGIERGRKRRPAGLRTYMIVCIASALVMITSQYMTEIFGTGDPARLGAQVISGIGFLGAGTIMITSRQVKGLTTAAGLWAVACIGLAVGIGFYAGAIFCAIFVLLVMTVLTGLDNRLRLRSKQVIFFGEFLTMEDLGKFMDMLRHEGYKLNDLELNRSGRSVGDLIGATFWIELDRPTDHIEVIRKLSGFDGVKYLEELEFV